MGYPESQYTIDELSSGIVPVVKSVQRGVTSAAGTISVGEVNLDKAILYSISKGSAGTVAARGTLKTSKVNISYVTERAGSSNTAGDARNASSTTNRTTSLPALTGTLSEGETDLTVKLYSAVLTSSTTIVCDGPVEWQLIEYY